MGFLSADWVVAVAAAGGGGAGLAGLLDLVSWMSEIGLKLQVEVGAPQAGMFLARACRWRGRGLTCFGAAAAAAGHAGTVGGWSGQQHHAHGADWMQAQRCCCTHGQGLGMADPANQGIG